MKIKADNFVMPRYDHQPFIFGPSIIVHAPRRRANPVTDDMRVMLNDIDRIEPLPVKVLDRHIRAVAAQMAADLDRQLLQAIRGVR